MRPIKTFLVIEDSDDMRAVIVEILRSQGYDVTQAPNGRKGLEQAIASRPDFIVCDIEMPEMDGFRVLEELRKNNTTMNTPLLFLTGLTTKEAMRKGMNLGADDFLSKPFTAQELLSAVDARKRHAQASNDKAQRDLETLRDNIAWALPHELRTPLNGILGFAELLKEQADDLSPQEVKEMSQHISGSARRLHQTLERFWRYTQIEILASKDEEVQRLRASSESLSKVWVRSIAADRAREDGRVDDLDLNLTEATMAVHAEYFKWILEELIDNAFKFSRKGDRVSIESGAENGRPYVRITNPGRGFRPEQISGINAFIQFDRRLHEQQGLGLGLKTAMRIVEMFNGSVRIESEPDKLTTVTVSLPPALL